MLTQQSKVFAVAVAVVVAMLAGLAVVLIDSHSTDRNYLEERFSRRTQVAAALTSALFSATTTLPQQQQQLRRRYGSVTAPYQALTEDAREDIHYFQALLDERGGLIGVSAGAPSAVRDELRPTPAYVEAVLDGRQPVALSDFVRLGGDTSTQVFAQPIETEQGRRILVTGFKSEILFAFLSQTLAKLVDITGGHAYILDSGGAIVASSDAASRPGEPAPVAGLVDAVASGDAGVFGADQYFAANPVENSTWDVVSVAPEEEVFATVNGFGLWMPWLVFATLTLAAAVAFALLWRVLRGADELAETHQQLDASNQALRQRASDLERSNTELEQFASIASHDLQEPLRKVRMFSDRVVELDADQLSEKGGDYLRRSSEAASRMQLLIEDLLKFSRVTTENRPFVSTDLARTARHVVSDLEGSIQAAGGSVEIGDLPTMVVDEPQIRQLFQNLISNAIKFRREGVPPVVRIEGGIEGHRAEIRVSDNGIGFDTAYASRIFRVFERLHGGGVYAGNGMGLALCRRIAERHGGAIVAESTSGEGSTFTVTLPLRRSVEPEPRRERTSPTTDRERETANV